MQFIKVRDVKSPERNVNENAGIDFYIPENNTEFILSFLNKNPTTQFDINTGEITIEPHCDVLIPSGIKSKFEPNLALIANNKSGIATKKKLIVGATVIDSSYQGEWHLHVINTSNKAQTIKCGQKIIQFIPHVISTDPVEIFEGTEAEFFTETTSRGSGGFGSTGV